VAKADDHQSDFKINGSLTLEKKLKELAKLKHDKKLAIGKLMTKIEKSDTADLLSQRPHKFF
jgi:hypothetical protein